MPISTLQIFGEECNHQVVATQLSLQVIYSSQRKGGDREFDYAGIRTTNNEKSALIDSLIFALKPIPEGSSRCPMIGVPETRTNLEHSPHAKKYLDVKPITFLHLLRQTNVTLEYVKKSGVLANDEGISVKTILYPYKRFLSSSPVQLIYARGFPNQTGERLTPTSTR